MGLVKVVDGVLLGTVGECFDWLGAFTTALEGVSADESVRVERNLE